MKKIICFLWAFVSILCLSGCTDSKDVPEDTAQADHPYRVYVRLALWMSWMKLSYRMQRIRSQRY